MRAILLTQLSVFAFAAAAQAGLIHTVAGGGSSYGDGGPATAAQLTTPQGLAFDAAGNLYIADDSAFVVRRVDAATGIITTVAGDGNFGDQGDGGPATSASLAPSSVAVDLFGDLYIADQLNHRIRKVDLGTGTITTIAGSGFFGNSGDQGPAVNALLGFPEGVAVDAIGDVYIADTANAAVRKVIRATGIIIRIAGAGVTGTSTGDGGLATAATFTTVRRVAVDLAGNVFIADANEAASAVRRIDALSGIIDRVAGGGSSTGESGLATDANLFDLRSVAVDDSGNLYVASGARVWKVDASGNIAVHAGTGSVGFSGDGGPAALATLGDVGGVAVASNGDVYISDFGNARVRKVDADVLVPAMGLTAHLLTLALLAALAIPLARGRRVVR